MSWRVYERNGQIALSLGWQNDWDEPIRFRRWIVGKAKASRYPGIIGKTVTFRGDVGRVYNDRLHRTVVLDTSDENEWHEEIEEKCVRKPPKARDGSYDYEWRDGEWRKVWL
jgi:hypothetical protein